MVFVESIQQALIEPVQPAAIRTHQEMTDRAQHPAKEIRQHKADDAENVDIVEWRIDRKLGKSQKANKARNKDPSRRDRKLHKEISGLRIDKIAPADQQHEPKCVEAATYQPGPAQLHDFSPPKEPVVIEHSYRKRCVSTGKE